MLRRPSSMASGRGGQPGGIIFATQPPWLVSLQHQAPQRPLGSAWFVGTGEASLWKSGPLPFSQPMT